MKKAWSKGIAPFAYRLSSDDKGWTVEHELQYLSHLWGGLGRSRAQRQLRQEQVRQAAVTVDPEEVLAWLRELEIQFIEEPTRFRRERFYRIEADEHREVLIKCRWFG
jgi:hypothetical protein